jgi:hypothetical protein
MLSIGLCAQGEVAWERSGEGAARILRQLEGPVAAKRCEADDA